MAIAFPSPRIPRFDLPALLVALALVLGGAVLTAAEDHLDPAKLEAIDATIEKGMADGHFTGAIIEVRHGTAHYHKAFGKRSVDPEARLMELDTVFDAASLTKVTATAPSIMILADRGQLNLNAPVARYIPEFVGGGKEAISVRHLLTHTSGLKPILRRDPPWQGHEKAIELACAEETTTKPGTEFRYSDINYIVLGEVVRRVSGERLDVFASKAIYEPLGMKDTRFLPPKELLPRIAPTERTEADGLLHGIVHDPSARSMGGVAGHAGLFTTAHDLARYATMLLNKGRLGDTRILSERAVDAMTRDQTPWRVKEKRGLGWDIETRFSHPKGAHFSDRSFGHTGWTGQAIWIDPARRAYVILLTTRNHPFERRSIRDIQREVSSLAAEAMDPGLSRPADEVGDASAASGTAGAGSEPTPPAFTSYAGAAGAARRPRVKCGIDVLRADGFSAIAGLRIGLITNHTGIAGDGASTIDLLHGASNVELKVLFSPEHGIRGEEDQAVVDDSRDEKTGLPVVSLYKGKDRKPTAAQLAGLDALVFDIQDIGTRFYTYISTMGLCMEAAEAAGIRFFVLDRVNPITGSAIEGPLPAGDAPYSFTAFHSIPIQHGMTVGEMASLFRAERNPKLDLQVIPLEGWKRSLWFDETGLPWINPSPNMRSPTAALLYPGIGLLEFSNLSVGRGTATPFEWVGAPFIDPDTLTRELEAAGLPGIRFHPARFTPESSVYRGEACGAVRFEITDRDAFQPVRTGLVLAQTLLRLHPDSYQPERINRLLAQPAALDALKAGRPIGEIERAWAAERESFLARRKAHLLYR